MKKNLKETFEKIAKNVNFIPWVGLNYNDQKKKILLLGESHYIPAQDRIVTEYIISSFLVGQIKLKFLENITKAFLCKEIGEYPFDNEVINFWQSVAFYNYIQKPVEESNSKPSPELILAAQLPFSQVLKILKPDILLCVSVRLYEKWLPDKMLDLQIDGKYAGQLTSDKFRSRATWYYKIDSNTFTFVSRLNKHPSWWMGKEDCKDSQNLIEELKTNSYFITSQEYENLK
jgi:hypothetical protein